MAEWYRNYQTAGVITAASVKTDLVAFSASGVIVSNDYTACQPTRLRDTPQTHISFSISGGNP